MPTAAHLLLELQDRLAMEVAANCLVSEELSETVDRSTARYVVTANRRTTAAVIDRLATQLGCTTEHRTTPDGLIRTTVDASVQVEASDNQLDAYPTTFYVGDDVFNVAANGDFKVLCNGELLSDGLGSPAEAFGKLITNAYGALLTMEQADGTVDVDATDRELLIGIIGLFSRMNLSDKARKALVDFYELTALTEFPPAPPEEVTDESE